jgi:hypothetical protein
MPRRYNWGLEGQWRDCVIVEKLLDDPEGG